MKYIEALEIYAKKPNETSLFIAGGITNCPDWQQELVELLSDTDLIILNPRRKDFPIHDPNASYEQILWEHKHLRKADMIPFWFPGETICPIVLYELGAFSMTSKPIFIGTHPEYTRIRDVKIQSKFARPEVEIVNTLGDLAGQVINSL